MIPALLIAAVLQATPETLAELERAYDQTCNNRLYGQFDDMCSSLEARVKSYRAELKRRPARPAPPSAAPATPDTTFSAPPPSPAAPPDAREPASAPPPRG